MAGSVDEARNPDPWTTFSAAVLSAGVLPFLPGAAVKIVLAAGLVHWLDRRLAVAG
jgi:biotin transporter BioY